MIYEPLTEKEKDKVESMMNNPDIQLAMRLRCEEQGHVFSPVITWRGGFPGPIIRRQYTRCEWCG